MDRYSLIGKDGIVKEGIFVRFPELIPDGKEGNLDIHSKQARLTLSGAVNVTVKGECHDFAYAATGSSSVKKEGLNKGEE